MPTGRLIVRIRHAGVTAARPDKSHRTSIRVVMMRLQCEHCLAVVVGEEDRLRNVRLPGHAKIESHNMLSHGRHRSGRSALTCRAEGDHPLMPRAEGRASAA